MNKLYLILALAVILVSCGQQVAPTGGPRDSIPPKLMMAVPDVNAKNFKSDRITLYFDEYVTLDNPFEKITYSPIPKINPNTDGKLRTVTIKIKDTLEPNTTYSIDFGESIKDVNEGNILKNFNYAFSTGDYIDSAFFTGQVFIAETGLIDSTLVAVLHNNLDDSAVAKIKPRYFARLKGDGSFLFRNLKPGNYNLFAIRDQNGDRKYDQPSELIAFLNNTINIGTDTSTTLYAFEAERTDTPIIKKSSSKQAAKKTEDRRLRFSNNFDGGRQDLLSDLIFTSEHPLKTFDSTKVQLTDFEFKAIPNFSISKDSTNKKITIKTAWKEGAKYNLIIQKDAASDTIDNAILKTDTLTFNAKKEADYGSVDLKIENFDSTLHPIVFLNKNSKTFLKQSLIKNRYKVKLFEPGDYEVKILFDLNNNGKWDTGDYWKKIQPERVVARKKPISIRANWDNEILIDLNQINEQ
ncbi:MAG: hypothetical protein RL713_502 [Bacteroidota bacterium]|jgi:uncharacterized protein (DUF2141 family)